MRSHSRTKHDGGAYPSTSHVGWDRRSDGGALAMYDSEGYFVENSINGYSIGDRDKLNFNDDGSLDIYIQHETPKDEKESNWLPAPGDDFNLVIRLYWPRAEILTGAWNPPAVKRVD